MRGGDLLPGRRRRDGRGVPGGLLLPDTGGESGVPGGIRMPGRSAHHEVSFGAAGQTVSLRHDTLDRSCYMPLL